jgi:hypothetical protein
VARTGQSELPHQDRRAQRRIDESQTQARRFVVEILKWADPADLGQGFHGLGILGNRQPHRQLIADGEGSNGRDEDASGAEVLRQRAV